MRALSRRSVGMLVAAATLWFVGSPDQAIPRAQAAPGWQGWQEVPDNGTTPDAPAAAYYNGHLYTFVRGSGGANLIYVKELTYPITWGPWYEVPGGGSTDAGPAAVAYKGKLHLFVKGNSPGNANIYVNSYSDAAGPINSPAAWSGWQVVPGASSPSAPGVAVYKGALQLLQRNPDSRIYLSTWRLPFPGWSARVELPFNTGLTPSGPDAATYKGKLYAIVQGLGSNNNIYQNVKYFPGNPGAWTGWSLVPGFGATPDSPAAATFGGRLYAVVRGTDNNVYYNTLRLPFWGWGSWQPIPGQATASGPAAAPYFDSLYVIVRGPLDRIFYNRFVQF